MANPSWPELNAALNALSAVLLIFGYGLIRRKQVLAHRVCMSTAFGASVLFLISYLIYHARVGSVHYPGTGFKGTLYFTILTSHTILALVIVPLILRTFYLALHQRWDPHRALARWTLPLWFYVSVTGVVIFKMLYY